MTQGTQPIIWDGAGANPSGLTPFGFYDSDPSFLSDGPKVADWCARHLGFPILDVELTDMQFYACFEEAITEYSAQVNQFNIRENMLVLQGVSTGSSVTQQYVPGTPIPNLVRISKQYGAEIGVGGTVNLKSGYITTSDNQQQYDLQALWADEMENGNHIDIMKVYYESSPAIARYFDPYAGAGIGLQNLMTEFGFDGYSPAVSFVMMPAYEDLLRIQAIEFNDMIRKSQFSFQITNNTLWIFPIPPGSCNIWFDYVVTNDKFNSVVDFSSSGSVISDYSNVPYTFIEYSNVNDVGRMWIFKYTLALSKEMLGNIRSKYQTIPIPNAEVSLDGATLRTEATQEKEVLMTQLRESLLESGRQKQMEKNMENSKNMKEIFKGVPLFIYIG